MKCSLGISNFLEEISAAAAKSLQSCLTLSDPWAAAHQAPPSMGFSRQETPHYWCGLPFPSPGMDLKEAEDIKKRWQEYTELYKKDLHDQDNHDGMIIYAEPDILEGDVKWTLKTLL